MSERISETIEVTELPEEKKLRVKYTVEDKLSPAEFVMNYEQLENQVKGDKGKLEGLDEQREKLKEALSKQIEMNNPKVEMLSPHIAKAKVWKAEEAAKAQRAGKKPEDPKQEGDKPDAQKAN